MPRDAEQIYDEWLIARIRCGERDALEELLTRWHPKWLAFALHRVGREDIARDVVQESAIAICRGIRRLDDGAAFRAWAYRIVARRSADALRTRARRQRHERASDSSTTPAPPAEPHTEPDAVVRAMEHLDEADRELIRLRYGSDLSVEEIGRVVGIAPGTVKSRLHAARGRVREFLAHEGDHQ